MDTKLPRHLAERARWIVDPASTSHGPGEFVLYWAHNAIRGHENPALDVAICLARQNGLPLLVYHGLSETYPYASDRHHVFILQGARDLQRELAARGIQYGFSLQRNGYRGPHLRDLARRAAVLVTEEMPVPPLTTWIDRLTIVTTTPLVSVDTSCVVPAVLLNQAYSRAFEFRNATQELYQQRVEQPYHEQPVDCVRFAGQLPFESLDLQAACLASLVGECRIDHSIAPVAESPGGTRAGYRRWQSFQQDALESYAARRNDAQDAHGVSRISPYLHYGMVSPFRLAREAKRAGAEKFLDELLIWRELSFHFCFHHRDHLDTFDAVPRWAQQTLLEHRGDEREASHSWESLARAMSDDPLWNACQRSLVKHGELHNNLRMTWGKAFLPWLDTPARALQVCTDLNNRFALDGRDPNSYGGILWCFGLFDRPFSPPRPVLGQVRPRPLDEHVKRIDLDQFQALVDRPLIEPLPRVAIIGAGLGGLVAARTYADHGIPVQLFEKSRGVGGRLATRRIPDGVTFDHGAQYFTARDPRFARLVQSWTHDGIVAPWLGRIVELGSAGETVSDRSATPRYVGVPSMNAIAKHLANDLNVQHNTRITAIERDAQGRWCLLDAEQRDWGPFDYVISNCPAPQTFEILRGHSQLDQQIQSALLKPCWALLLQFDGDRAPDYDGAFVNHDVISWIARNGRKPGRLEHGQMTWVVHATSAWSSEHLEISPAEAERELTTAFASVTGLRVRRPTYSTAHRWRYAIPDPPLPENCLWDPTTGIGVCGDWCGGPRVEGAYLSGVAIAGSMLRHLTVDRPPRASG